MSLQIRAALPQDHNFILATWLKSYRELVMQKPVPERDIYFREHQKKIKEKLESAKCLVATTDDSDQICGFICYESDAVHYVFVKTVFRRYGIANKLLDAAAHLSEFSHFTKFTPFFQRRKLTFNPYRF